MIQVKIYDSKKSTIDLDINDIKNIYNRTCSHYLMKKESIYQFFSDLLYAVNILIRKKQILKRKSDMQINYQDPTKLDEVLECNFNLIRESILCNFNKIFDLYKKNRWIEFTADFKSTFDFEDICDFFEETQKIDIHTKISTKVMHEISKIANIIILAENAEKRFARQRQIKERIAESKQIQLKIIDETEQEKKDNKQIKLEKTTEATIDISDLMRSTIDKNRKIIERGANNFIDETNINPDQDNTNQKGYQQTQPIGLDFETNIIENTEVKAGTQNEIQTAEQSSNQQDTIVDSNIKSKKYGFFSYLDPKILFVIVLLVVLFICSWIIAMAKTDFKLE